MHMTRSRQAKNGELTKEKLREGYRLMLLARKIDEKAIILYKQNKCHFQIGCAGHEAITVAAALSMKPGHDWAFPYYRDMGFCTGYGVTAKELFLAILNRADDPSSGGRMMPNHYGHAGQRIVQQSSPTGTQFLQAVGVAHASQFRGNDEIVYVSSGEGTTAQGCYYEALNWAARKSLPLIFVIQDNQYAISVKIQDQIAGASVSEVAAGFKGLHIEEVDGVNFAASYDAMQRAVKRARSGKGPSLLVSYVVRLQSHSISDNQKKYRSEDDILADSKRDPLPLLAKHLVSKKVLSQDELERISVEVQAEVDAAAVWAEAQAIPRPETVETHVLSLPDPALDAVEAALPPKSSLQSDDGSSLFLVDAINVALDEEMARNPEVVVYGEDVAYGKGGVFTVTAGLTAKYSDKRVFNSPLAEASIIGTAIGMATVGMKPVVEIQFGDYIWPAMNDLRNELAMLSYRSDGHFQCPVVVRVAVGGYIHGGLYHSQNLEATFSHFPGLHVVLPSNAWDAKGLLKSAIRSSNPVLFLEHKGLYRQVYAKGPRGGKEDLIPIGKAKVVRTGEDATLITWGALVQKSLLAAEAMNREGYSIEVIDLRSIVPLDIETILTSVKKTGRVLIAHEDVLFMGFGAEIAAHIAEHAFEYLDAPVKRVGGKFVPIPHAPILEEASLPQTAWVERGLRELLEF